MAFWQKPCVTMWPKPLCYRVQPYRCASVRTPYIIVSMAKIGSVEYRRLHRWVGYHKGAASAHRCTCGSLATDWAQKHGTTGESLEDYVALCRTCHIRYDRVVKSKQNPF